jgi:hypothetical protein
MSRCALRAQDTGTNLSSAPCRMSVGTATSCSLATKLVRGPSQRISFRCQDLQALDALDSFSIRSTSSTKPTVTLPGS